MRTARQADDISVSRSEAFIRGASVVIGFLNDLFYTRSYHRSARDVNSFFCFFLFLLVSVVIPIASTGPFFSLILTAMFLRDVERVTLRIVLSAAMIVGGVLIITLRK